MYLHFIDGHMVSATEHAEVIVPGSTVVEYDTYDRSKLYTLVNGVVVEGDASAKLEAEIAEMANFDYINNRRNEYPSIVDQLDTLYHGGYDAWRAQIQAVKDQYPKPN